MLSVLPLFILHKFPDVIRHVVVILAFAFVCKHNIFLFSTKSD